MTAERAGRPAGRARAARKRTASNVAFLVHSATGLWLTLLLAVVMVTGTIMVLFAEIDWLIYPRCALGPAKPATIPTPCSLDPPRPDDDTLARRFIERG